MEQGYGCPACGGQHPVNWLITRLSPPQTVSTCEQDLESALLALLAERMEVPAEWLIETINTGVDLLNRPVAEEPAEPEPAKPKRRRKPAAEPEFVTESGAVADDEQSMVRLQDDEAAEGITSD